MRRRTAIFHLASGGGDSPGRPIYEYARNLVAAQRRHALPDVDVDFLTFDNFDWRRDEASLAAEVRERARRLEAQPVVLLHTVLPFVGAVVSPEFLAGFPSVLFPHQFTLLPEADRRRTFEYVRRAGRCLVTTPIEIEQAAAMARRRGRPGERRIAERFTTVGQPPSIRPGGRAGGPVAARSGDVAVFGMIRRGKGLDQVLSLAEHLRTDPRLAGKTIHLIGHAADRRDSVALLKLLTARIYGLGLEVRHASRRAAQALVGDLVAVDQGGRALAELTLAETCRLLRLLEGGARPAGGAPPERLFHRLTSRRHGVAARGPKGGRTNGLRRLPVKLYVSLPGPDVSAVLSRCTYGYLPVVGGELELAAETLGLTKHSSVAPTLAAHGMVLLAPIGSLTPEELRNGEVVDVRDGTDAAAAIRRLDEDPERRSFHVERALRWSRTDSWDDVAAAALEQCRAARRDFRAAPAARMAGARDG